MTALSGDDKTYVAVAVPVPLTRAFTYCVPPHLSESVSVGCRVAVPFGRRKLAGYVLQYCTVTGAQTEIKEVAAVLDPEPLFTPELMNFLREAAGYYLYPLGSVLRAAAPAMRSEAVEALRQQGFLAGKEHLGGSRIKTRKITLVRLCAAPESERLGKTQEHVVELIRQHAEISLQELCRQQKNARTVVRSLIQKGLVATVEREAPADPFFAAALPSEPLPTLNRAQQAAVAAIIHELPDPGKEVPKSEPGAARPRAFLLHGVTGSGKTEVYLRVIAEARARGLGALVLVPEIALTPQLVARFRARFSDAIAVLHSGLRPRERFEAWRGLREGRINLAIGARSALFAPVNKLGVVVVDEEHDASFKQEEGFRYHARDMALLRADRAGAIAVLGSATPSLESYYRARQGKLRLLNLPERATAQQLPRVEVVDLTRHRNGPSPQRLITGPLYQALQSCLAAREQAILFLNRRGFAPSIVCENCGEIAECPACSVALTEHRRAGLLRCHYCDYAQAPAVTCQTCGASQFQSLGLGTEQLQGDLSTAFPSARVARLDRDTASGDGVERVLTRMRKGEIDILVGTQMVAKGHDIPGVTLVGVILADQSLAFPDFRAAERTFQLLAQVAGRAGRGERAGRVVIQAYQVDHTAVRCAAEHDFIGFYQEELRARHELTYPPFSHMIAVRVDAASEPMGRQAVATLTSVARAHPLVQGGQVQLLGPAPAPITRLRARYRFRLMLYAANRPALHQVAAALSTRIDGGLGTARANLDVDPVSML